MIDTKSFSSRFLDDLDSQVNTFIRNEKVFVTAIQYNDTLPNPENDEYPTHYAHMQFRDKHQDKN